RLRRRGSVACGERDAGDPDHGPDRKAPDRGGHPPAQRPRLDDPQARLDGRLGSPEPAPPDRWLDHDQAMTEPSLILVVEDNEANQLLATSVLMREGYRVEVAGSAEEALETLKRQSPDLILMDVQLPGKDGLQLTKELKADPVTAPIPIVALTALAMVGDRERTLGAGCVGYISKPIDTRTLGAQVREFLE